jgi:hypothetical protein
MLLAEWDVILAGVAAGLGTALGAGVTALIALLGFMRKGKRADERTAIGYYRGLIDELKKQLDRHGEHMADQVGVIDLLRAQLARCDIDATRVWGAVDRQADYIARCRELLRGAGLDAGPQPEPPQRRCGAEDRMTAEFAVRSAKENTALLKELDGKVKNGGTPR